MNRETAHVALIIDNDKDLLREALMCVTGDRLHAMLQHHLFTGVRTPLQMAVLSEAWEHIDVKALHGHYSIKRREGVTVPND